MKIIKRIEVSYFRSVYSVDMRYVNDLNILIGGNDSGKSNILKALNLFFNNKTELGQSYYFTDDLTRKREQEARDAKGRATIWIKVHFYNFLKWKSLPNEFVIKKVWNRYSEQPEVTYPKGLPITTVAKFLNKISFHYVPAIRGRDIFSYYLSLLHDALLDDEKAGLINSTDVLMKTLNESTMDMSKRIRDGVGIESNIQPPTNLRILFNALDFSTGYDFYNIPLQKRGDGIQSRHIPYILDFIAGHTKAHHIWAYEEPETSLELGAAFVLAKQFSEEFSKENQIFLTTHSPAFYDLNENHISKWYVFQRELDNGCETHVENVSSGDVVDQKLGVAALVAQRAKEAYEQIERLKNNIERLDSEILLAAKPHVIVEGITDKIILDNAYKKLYPGDETICEFLHAEGAANIPPYLKSAKILSKKFSHPVIGLFDRDSEGRKQMKCFDKSTPVVDTVFYRVSTDRQVYAGLLPIPLELQDIEVLIRKELPIPIEFIFPENVINEALENNIIILDDRIFKAQDPEFPTDINISEYYSSLLPAGKCYLSKKINSNKKKDFSCWVLDKPAEYFENFRPLFEQLKIVINLTQTE